VLITMDWMMCMRGEEADKQEGYSFSKKETSSFVIACLLLRRINFARMRTPYFLMRMVMGTLTSTSPAGATIRMKKMTPSCKTGCTLTMEREISDGVKMHCPKCG